MLGNGQLWEKNQIINWVFVDTDLSDDRNLIYSREQRHARNSKQVCKVLIKFPDELAASEGDHKMSVR